MRYHLTDDGPKVCKASKKPCPLGGEHFDSSDAAEAAFALTFESGGLGGSSRNTDGKASAEISKQYSHWSVMNYHMHNSSAIGSPQELLYYSTPQGKLELARRLSYDERTYRPIADSLADGIGDLAFQIDSDYIAEQAAKGAKLVPTDSHAFDSTAGMNDDRDALRHFLTEESYRWLSKLTPEQQEAVSWSTSNGFGIAQYGIGVETDRTFISFKGIIDENAIYDEIPDWDTAEAKIKEEQKKYAERYVETLRSAFKEVPKLDSPVVIGRGTTIAELAEILGEKGSKDSKSLMDRLESGEYTGKPIDPDSRMKKLPLSATASPIVAGSFGKSMYDDDYTEDRDIVITLKGRSFASPVNVSAWGAAEYEVFTNPNSEYRIAGGRRLPDGSFVLELEESD